MPRVLGIHVLPDLSQRREKEDSERSSDEARQCEAEAALELSKVAALLLDRWPWQVLADVDWLGVDL